MFTAMALFRRERRGYIDGEMSRSETYRGALFIFAAAVVVAKVAEPEFDTIFWVASVLAVLLLAFSKHKLGYVAATFGWIASRFALGSVVQRDPTLLIWAAASGAAAWAIVYAAARSEMHDYSRRRW